MYIQANTSKYIFSGLGALLRGGGELHCLRPVARRCATDPCLRSQVVAAAAKYPSAVVIVEDHVLLSDPETGCPRKVKEKSGPSASTMTGASLLLDDHNFKRLRRGGHHA